MFLDSRLAISPSQNVWNFLLFSPAIPRLFTVPYFFVRSFRFTASYRHGYLDFKCTKGAGVGEYSSGGRGWGREKYFSRFLPNRSRPLSSFDTHATWQPVTQSARSRWSYGKIEDCEQSKLYQNSWHRHSSFHEERCCALRQFVYFSQCWQPMRRQLPFS